MRPSLEITGGWSGWTDTSYCDSFSLQTQGCRGTRIRIKIKIKIKEGQDRISKYRILHQDPLLYRFINMRVSLFVENAQDVKCLM
jgi:hypothetical protein